MLLASSMCMFFACTVKSLVDLLQNKHNGDTIFLFTGVMVVMCIPLLVYVKCMTFVLELTLILQDHQGISNAAPADAPLYPLSISMTDNASGHNAVDDGTVRRIHDHVSNLRFSISPTAFFQVDIFSCTYILIEDFVVCVMF